MSSRSGGFSTPGGLDPFGGSRGGLGRYNVTGEDIANLAATEAYAVQVAWSNGQATDAEYLASLQKMVDLSNPGTSDRTTAENRLHDAKYTIGRNSLIRAVNAASSPAERQAGLEQVLAYDRDYLGTMTSHDSQAYRDQQERVTSTEVEIRQSRYSALVEKVNRGHASTEELLTLAKQLGREAGNAPDKDNWDSTIGTLADRVKDEKLADAFQSYQHHRKSGQSVMDALNERISEVDPGSPAYKELVRQREDLRERIKQENASIREQKVQGQRQSGKLSDGAFLSYLRDAYNNEDPGTADKIAAGNRLHEFTFSLAEDKLRFDVQRGKRPVSALVAFYKSYLRGMNPNSERYRQLASAIRSLGGGGGRGGSGGKGGKGIALGPKLIAGISAMQDLLTVGADGKRVKAPPDFGGLFQIDIRSKTAAKWWDNNRREIEHAFMEGAATWTYHDKSGREYQMPFEPDMMGQVDHLNVAYMRDGLRLAKTDKALQAWTGKLITATNSLSSHASHFTMDVYTAQMRELNAAKERAMAGGRYAEYVNLVGAQREWIRKVLGIPAGAPTDIGLSQNPYLSAKEAARIGNDLASIAPQNFDQQDELGYNPTGDPVLSLVQDGGIVVHADPHSGEALSAELDPNRGYVTLDEHGNVTLRTVDPEDPRQWQTNTDPETGEPISQPAYFTDTVAVHVRINGVDAVVHQPITKPPTGNDASSGLQGLPVYGHDRGPTSVTGTPGGGYTVSNPVASMLSGILRNDGRIATLPTFQTFTIENGHRVVWVSLDGKTWLRYDPAVGVQPRIVLPDNVRLGANGSWQVDGKDVSPAAVVQLPGVHFWGAAEGGSTHTVHARGVSKVTATPYGGPYQHFITRVVGEDGMVDLRPQSVVEGEQAELAIDTGRKAIGQLEEFGKSDVGQALARSLGPLAGIAGELLPPGLRGDGRGAKHAGYSGPPPRTMDPFARGRDGDGMLASPRPRDLLPAPKPPDAVLKLPSTADLTNFLSGLKLPDLTKLKTPTPTKLAPPKPLALPKPGGGAKAGASKPGQASRPGTKPPPPPPTPSYNPNRAR